VFDGPAHWSCIFSRRVGPALPRPGGPAAGPYGAPTPFSSWGGAGSGLKNEQGNGGNGADAPNFPSPHIMKSLIKAWIVFLRCATIGSCGSVPADWTTPPPVGNSSNYTRPTAAQPDTEHAHSDDAEYFRSHDYNELEYDARDMEYGADDDLDASAYGVTSSTRPEVRPLVVDIYAVSDTQRRHDASHVVYSWSRDGGRPVTSLDGYDDDYEDYDDYSDVIVSADGSAGRRRGHVTSYVGQSGSEGHETSLGQSRWREVEVTADNNAAEHSSALNRRYVVAIATTAAAATVAMAAVR